MVGNKVHDVIYEHPDPEEKCACGHLVQQLDATVIITHL